jgi:hypothetical protein
MYHNLRKMCAISALCGDVGHFDLGFWPIFGGFGGLRHNPYVDLRGSDGFGVTGLRREISRKLFWNLRHNRDVNRSGNLGLFSHVEREIR